MAFAQDDAPPSAEQLFEQARQVWAAMPYPSTVDYGIAVAVSNGETHQSDHFHGEVHSATGVCRVHAFSDEEEARPAHPHGTNVSFNLSVGFSSAGGFGVGPPPSESVLSVPLSPREVEPAFGVPEISPLYTFGLRGTAPRITDDADSPGATIIGRVQTLRKRYAVALAGRESIGGDDAYHLSLTPLFDGKRDRVRDLWVSVKTNHVLQARVLGNFTVMPLVAMPWLIRFADIDGSTYIASETSEVPFSAAPRVNQFTITFSALRPHHGSEDLLFAVPTTLKSNDYVREPVEGSGRPDAC